MPIIPAQPPESIVTAATKQVLAVTHLQGNHVLAGLADRGLELAAPHRVYVLSLEAVRNRNISEARFVGWEFLITDGDRVVGAAEVAHDEHRAVSVTRGPFSEATGEAMDRVEDIAELAEGEHEFRILRVNALYAVAAWAAGKQNLFVPLAPAPPYLTAWETYDEEGFLAALNHPSALPFMAPVPK